MNEIGGSMNNLQSQYIRHLVESFSKQGIEKRGNHKPVLQIRVQSAKGCMEEKMNCASDSQSQSSSDLITGRPSVSNSSRPDLNKVHNCFVEV